MNFGDPRLPERFWSKVSPCPMSGCWIWTAAHVPVGYGRYSISGAFVYSHRAVYAVEHGAIPQGSVIDHVCRIPACCNPLHLEAVSQRENMLRGDTIIAHFATRTHCPRGHEYTANNTIVRRVRQSGTGRVCRLCNAERCSDRYYRERSST